MPSTFNLGFGIEFDSEFELTKNLIIRPYRIQYSHIELTDRTKNQIEYGFITSLAEFITFEMECLG